MLKRLFDLMITIPVLVLLLPFFLIIAVLIKAGSKGPVFYKQVRVGLNNRDFKIFKFRTMHLNADKEGLLTVGGRDPRVLPIGYFLRKYKLDELPQLLNVLIGSMSLVGPRPEVRKYVDLYSIEQQKVLIVKPGITDYASIEYSEENDLLALSSDPEKTYIEDIMPAKLLLNQKYIDEISLLTDFKIILRTAAKIISH